MILPGATVGVLGGGQLGRMFVLRGSALAKFVPVGMTHNVTIVNVSTGSDGGAGDV